MSTLPLLSQGSVPLLTTSIAHGLTSGDLVEVAGQEYLVEVVSDREFRANPADPRERTDGESGANVDEKRKRKSLSGEVNLKVRKWDEKPALTVSCICSNFSGILLSLSRNSFFVLLLDQIA